MLAAARERRRLRSRMHPGSWLCSTSTTQLHTAEAVFNADPRHFSDETEDNTRLFREIVADGFPDLDEREQRRITTVIPLPRLISGVASDA